MKIMYRIKGTISVAINWWLCDNDIPKGDQSFSNLRALLIQLFKYAISLHETLKNNPLPSIKIQTAGHEIGGKGAIIFISEINPYDFFRLRGILAIIGDMYIFLKEIKEFSKNLKNQDLFNLISNWLPSINKYRYARNFFAHLDERIGKKRYLHGVTGALKIPELGLEFTSTAEGCFYFGVSNNTVFFHDKQINEEEPTPKKISFGGDEMNKFFHQIRKIYNLLISHKTHEDLYAYPRAEELFGL